MVSLQAINQEPVKQLPYKVTVPKFIQLIQKSITQNTVTIPGSQRG